MGIEAYKAVWSNSNQVGTRKLLLLALAEFASEENDWRCWPSIGKLANMVGVSDRQIKTHLAALESSAEIIIRRGQGRGNTNEYDITPVIKGEVGFTFLEPEKVKSSAEKVKSSVIKGEVDFTQTIRNQKEPLFSADDDDDIDMLAKHFQSKTGLFANLGVYGEKWRRPLEHIMGVAGDYERAIGLIDGAIEFARNGTKKRYTITSPQSIVNIAVNLSKNGERAALGVSDV